jgi:hypothetical protein
MWGDLKSGRDRVLSMADKASAAEAVAELIWNGFDAEATEIDVSIATNELGAPYELVVEDRGPHCGIDPSAARDLFLTEGDSWKSEKKFSEHVRRPLHGRMGRGRLLSYSIADRVTWTSTYESDNGRKRTRIVGERSRPSGFAISPPEDTTDDVGTTVRLKLRDTQKVAKIGDPDFKHRVLERMAESLRSSDVIVRWQGQELDPEEVIRQRADVDLPQLDEEVLRGHGAPTLTVVEWQSDFGSKKVMLCTDSGATVTEYQPSAIPPVPFSWTAYLQWKGFTDPDLMGAADLHVPEVKHQQLLAEAERGLAAFLAKRLGAERGRIVQAWKDEGVYPYRGEPKTKLDNVERDLFDVVAVIASPAIPKRGTSQKKLTLRLLRESIRAEPGRLAAALSAVVQLNQAELESLDLLLQRISLGSIIRQSHKVADRLDFLEGLSSMLYADATKKTFNEIDHLHPLLVNEPWVFGDEWDLSYSEHGLTKVVRSAVESSGEAVLALEPVTLDDGRRGRVDMLFHKHHPESEQTRHLVVELKRPGKLTMKHYSQLVEYAVTISNHPEVAGGKHKWDFWLVGTDVDASVAEQRSDAVSYPGFVMERQTYRLWVITWGELLDQMRRKYEWYRSRLELAPTEQSGLDYLQRVHAEFLPIQDEREEVDAGDLQSVERPTTTAEVEGPTDDEARSGAPETVGSDSPSAESHLDADGAS